MRDILALLGEAYTLVEESRAGMRNIGLVRLQKKFEFDERAVPKGRLFVAKNIADSAGMHFR